MLHNVLINDVFGKSVSIYVSSVVQKEHFFSDANSNSERRKYKENVFEYGGRSFIKLHTTVQSFI